MSERTAVMIYAIPHLAFVAGYFGRAVWKGCAGDAIIPAVLMLATLPLLPLWLIIAWRER